ncbi:MAG: response regulator [Candidatus Omnitrophota bacterium]
MGKKKNILIVDDDVKIINSMKSFLEEKGYDVVNAPDGEVALDILGEIVPDLIILDIVMPKIDGFTVAKAIKYNEKTKDVPIIVISAKDGMKELFEIEGIKDYLIKPADHTKLLELIRNRLGE